MPAVDGMSLVTLREFRRHLSQRAGDPAMEGALIRIGHDYRGVVILPRLLESLAETGAVDGRSPALLTAAGNDLVCLLTSCSETRAVQFARILRARLQSTAVFRHGQKPRLAIGVVLIAGDPSDPERLLALADQACRDARRRGGSQIAICPVGRTPR